MKTCILRPRANRSMNNDLVGLSVGILSFGFEGNDSGYHQCHFGAAQVLPHAQTVTRHRE